MRATRELARMGRARLTRTGFGRAARFGSIALATFAVVWLIALRVADGAYAPALGVPVRVARYAFWLGAVPWALAAANERTLADRRDGIEALALSRGLTLASLAWARALCSVTGSARAILIPSLLAGVASAAIAPTVRVLVERALVLVSVATYGIASGVVLGALGALCDMVAPKRGRSVFIALAILSWAASDLANDPRLSLTGLLGSVLHETLRAFGLGRIG